MVGSETCLALCSKMCASPEAAAAALPNGLIPLTASSWTGGKAL